MGSIIRSIESNASSFPLNSEEANFEKIYTVFCEQNSGRMKLIKDLTLLKIKAEYLKNIILSTIIQNVNSDDYSLQDLSTTTFYERLKFTILSDLKMEGIVPSKITLQEKIFTLALKICMFLQSNITLPTKHALSIPEFDCIEAICDHKEKCPDLVEKLMGLGYKTIVRSSFDSLRNAYVYIAKIAEGNYNHIFRVYDLTSCDNKVFRVLKNPQKYLSLWKNTMLIKHQLSEKNIPGIVRSFAFYPNISIEPSVNTLNVMQFHAAEVLELCEGNLYSLIKKKKLTHAIVLDMMLQIFRTVSYLENEGLTHNDISMGNILYQEIEGRFETKLSDFDTTFFHSKSYVYFGTGYYNPKDLMASLPDFEMAKKKRDAWSLGIIFYELLKGSLRYDQTLKKITNAIDENFYAADIYLSNKKTSGNEYLIEMNKLLKYQDATLQWFIFFEKLTKDLKETKKPIDLLIANLLNIDVNERFSATVALKTLEELIINNDLFPSLKDSIKRD